MNVKAPRLDRGGALCHSGAKEKKMPTLIEKYLDRQIRKLRSQPLLLLLVAICFMGSAMKRAKKSMPGWAVQAL